MRRVLFITANRIGDGILSTGVLNHLVQTMPEAQFTVACGPLCVDLFKAVPRLERVIAIPKEKDHGHWIKLWKECSPIHWDLIVDLRNSLVSRLLKSKKKLARTIHDDGAHKVQQNGLVLGMQEPPSPFIWLSDDDKQRAQALLPDTHTPLLALGPAANWPGKQWPSERFAALAMRLIAPDGLLPNAKVLVLAAKHEQDQLYAVLRTVPDDKLITLFGADLRMAAACLQRASLFIGNDSGLMHLAAAVGVPTLGLFGPSNEKVYGPWGKNTALIRTSDPAEELFKRLPYPGAFYPCLMGGLAVDDVAAAAQNLLLRLRQ